MPRQFVLHFTVTAPLLLYLITRSHCGTFLQNNLLLPNAVKQVWIALEKYPINLFDCLLLCSQGCWQTPECQQLTAGPHDALKLARVLLWGYSTQTPANSLHFFLLKFVYLFFPTIIHKKQYCWVLLCWFTSPSQKKPQTVVCSSPGPFMFEKRQAWEVWAVLQAVGSTGFHWIVPYEPHPIFYTCPETPPTV